MPSKGKQQTFGRRAKAGKLDRALKLALRNRRELNQQKEWFVSPPNPSTLFINKEAFTTTPKLDYMTISGSEFSTLVKSLRIRMHVRPNKDSALITNWRIDLIRDKMPAGTDTATAELMYRDATPDVVTYLDFEQKERFETLRTWMGGGNGSLTQSSTIIDEYIKINKKSTTKTEENWTTTEIMTNSYWLVWWTDATANYPILECRFRFVMEGDRD